MSGVVSPGSRALKIAQFGAIFIGAFLIFQIQPIVGKIVTPKFGGTSAVWTFCLLFFQLVVLGGYLFTYFVSKLTAKRQAIVYGAAFLLSMLLFSVKGPEDWGSGDPGQPVFSLFVLLSQNLVCQCLLLASISGMMQLWYRLASLGNPYWLYALSNIGSMGALISYPILVEPNFTLVQCVRFWNMAYILLGILVVYSAIFVYRQGEDRQKQALEEEGGESQHPGSGIFVYWCFLTAMTSASLICYTQHLTQDIAPVPLLWVAPLVLFLLSYILCFSGERFTYSALYLALSAVLWIVDPFVTSNIEWSTVCILGYVFCFSMGLHSELVKSKPAPSHLAVFYLATAIGGAVGGLLENLLAPVVVTFYFEKVLFFVVIMVLLVRVTTRNWMDISIKSGITMTGKPRKVVFAIVAYLFFVASWVGTKIADRMIHPPPEVVVRMRDFYGCVKVEKRDNTTSLVNGMIIHGTQLNKPGLNRVPTRYFALDGGVGYSMRLIRDRLEKVGQPLNCAVVGLGSGTFACYSRSGDKFVYYEIDPNVIDIARHYFTFLSDSAATNEVVLGDGRVELEKASQKFNLIMIDAFNGNAVPVHLLTVEAFQSYLRHLEDDGFVLVNISNRHVNMEPVLGNLSVSLNLYATTFGASGSTWVLLSRTPFESGQFARDPLYNKLRIVKTSVDPKARLWSDNYSNIMALLIRD